MEDCDEDVSLVVSLASSLESVASDDDDDDDNHGGGNALELDISRIIHAMIIVGFQKETLSCSDKPMLWFLIQNTVEASTSLSSLSPEKPQS